MGIPEGILGRSVSSQTSGQVPSAQSPPINSKGCGVGVGEAAVDGAGENGDIDALEQRVEQIVAIGPATPDTART